MAWMMAPSWVSTRGRVALFRVRSVFQVRPRGARMQPWNWAWVWKGKGSALTWWGATEPPLFSEMMTLGSCWSLRGGGAAPLTRNRLRLRAEGLRPSPPHSPQPGRLRSTTLAPPACSCRRLSVRKSETTSSPAKASLISPLWSGGSRGSSESATLDAPLPLAAFGRGGRGGRQPGRGVRGRPGPVRGRAGVLGQQIQVLEGPAASSSCAPPSLSCASSSSCAPPSLSCASSSSSCRSFLLRSNSGLDGSGPGSASFTKSGSTSGSSCASSCSSSSSPGSPPALWVSSLLSSSCCCMARRAPRSYLATMALDLAQRLLFWCLRLILSCMRRSSAPCSASRAAPGSSRTCRSNCRSSSFRRALLWTRARAFWSSARRTRASSRLMALTEASSAGVSTGSWRGCLWADSRANTSRSRGVCAPQPTTTRSMGRGPDGSRSSGNTSCSARWFWLMTASQRLTRAAVFWKARSRWMRSRCWELSGHSSVRWLRCRLRSCFRLWAGTAGAPPAAPTRSDSSTRSASPSAVTVNSDMSAAASDRSPRVFFLLPPRAMMASSSLRRFRSSSPSSPSSSSLLTAPPAPFTSSSSSSPPAPFTSSSSSSSPPAPRTSSSSIKRFFSALELLLFAFFLLTFAILEYPKISG
ncbi:unnamed protein product [Menidia menidia]|uniref:(Atlantic silverside) hypothetical protein n=1 Tax=Menidia menidia TaxID=238744 RepID=A0A8S4AKE6_9TELE|nr:unnamed protein product [Menidia menidia]